jgi:hypothetical protein
MSGILAVDGIKKELEGKREQALADLRVYLQSPVGVGEHSGICAEIKRMLAAVGECDSVIDTIDRYVKRADDKDTVETTDNAESTSDNE